MTLLPPNATPLERDLDLVEAARAIDASVIAAQLDPQRCPASLLGYLAWTLSVDLWDDDWPELKKRQVCAKSFALHRSKGTLAGIRAHLALVDATLVRARRPRDRTFLVPRGEPAPMLATLPQLRVYPFVPGSIAQRRSFWRAAEQRPIRTSFDSGSWDFSSTGPTFDSDQRWGSIVVPRPIAPRPLGARDVYRSTRGGALVAPRTTIVENGIERDVGREELADGFRVLARPSRRKSWYGVGFAGQGFLTPSIVAEASYALRFDPAATAAAVQPGRPPAGVRPTRVHGGRMAPAPRAFAGRRGRRFMLPSYGPHLVYDQVGLYTADRLAERQRRRAWYGVGRLGHEPFTAELKIDVPLRRWRSRAGRWQGVGFMAAADLTPLRRAIEAIGVSKALRDTILVDTTNHRPVRFGDGLQFGSFAFGEIRKAA